MADDLQARLAAIFRGEYEEYSVQLQALLRQLEAGEPPEPLLHEAFRTAHNLKGAAGAIGLMPIAELSHQFESMLQKLRAGERALDPTVMRIGRGFLGQIDEWLSTPGLNWEEPQSSPLDEEIAAWLKGEIAAAPTPKRRRADRGSSEVDSVRIPLLKLESILSDVTELTLAQSRNQHRQLEVDAAFVQLHEMQKDWELLYSLQRKAARESGVKAQKLLEALERQRGRFRHFHSWFRTYRSRLLSERQRLALSIDTLAGEAQSLRLVPLDAMFEWLERQIGDLCERLGKEVSVELSGRETQLDRRLVEAVRDPLMHLVRNCVDHGLESAEERRAAGKDPVGRLRISARQQGQNICLEVSDDGGGISWARVRERARELGWHVEEDQLHELLFRPGFSTRDVVSEISGRGYGLDIVEARVKSFGGIVEVESEEGKGTRFSLRVPLTQATLHALLVRTSDQLFALSIATVERVVRVVSRETVGGRVMLRQGAQLLPLVRLSDLLGLPSEKKKHDVALVLSPTHHPVAIIVDEVLGDQELVVRGLGPLLSGLGRYSGAAVNDDGEVVLLLNAVELVREGIDLGHDAAPARPTRKADAPARQRILVVDDSITSRTLEKSILENAGYDVVTASDGEEGARMARTHAPRLVISDVEMPRMDGFQLCRNLKTDVSTRDIRVVLVTSLGSPEDRVRGKESGADAYVVKGEFDQNRLLALVADFLK